MILFSQYKLGTEKEILKEISVLPFSIKYLTRSNAGEIVDGGELHEVILVNFNETQIQYSNPPRRGGTYLLRQEEIYQRE